MFSKIRPKKEMNLYVIMKTPYRPGIYQPPHKLNTTCQVGYCWPNHVDKLIVMVWSCLLNNQIPASQKLHQSMTGIYSFLFYFLSSLFKYGTNFGNFPALWVHSLTYWGIEKSLTKATTVSLTRKLGIPSG